MVLHWEYGQLGLEGTTTLLMGAQEMVPLMLGNPTPKTLKTI